MLTLADVAGVLRRYVDEQLPWQVMDPVHPGYGGFYNPDLGLVDPGHAWSMVAALALAALAEGGHAGDLVERATLGTEFLLHAQRPSGLIDLVTVNIDSGPDTAFSVQQLCAVIELGRVRAAADPRWAALLQSLERYVRRAVPGMQAGGFHTPNHRWVIVSALVQAKALFPDLDVAETVRAYLAEGFDLDPEGFYIERSAGVYDSVNDRSLYLIAQHWDSPQAMPAVARNLDLNLYLLHADATAETGLSRRQDYGIRSVPGPLAACYLLAYQAHPEPAWLAAAQALWEASGGPNTWLCYALLKYGEPPAVPAALPDDYSRLFPENGLWRVRRGPLSASFFRDTTRLLSLVYGRAELTALKISLTYFGQTTGRFISDSLDVQAGQAVLRSEGRHNPRRPGYELPLDRPVPPERWHAMLDERALHRLPPLTSTLTADETPGGFTLRYRTLDGMDGVAAQVALDFPPGGIWETDDTAVKPAAGQVLFLKQGYGIMRSGSDAIRIGPGACAHTMWQMREADAVLDHDHVRVLLTFHTPVDHTFTVTGRRGP